MQACRKKILTQAHKRVEKNSTRARSHVFYTITHEHSHNLKPHFAHSLKRCFFISNFLLEQWGAYNHANHNMKQTKHSKNQPIRSGTLAWSVHVQREMGVPKNVSYVAVAAVIAVRMNRDLDPSAPWLIHACPVLSSSIAPVSLLMTKLKIGMGGFFSK